MTARRLNTVTGACDETAAAVFELGILDASPTEKTLGYLACCVVAGLTATQPDSSAAVSPSAHGVMQCRKGKSHRPNGEFRTKSRGP
jgi:hypothetical protein